ncbi:MAG: hypothetical protein IT388_01365 [Nitrospirales bacterium]|nr:hypothetical protein [Nitrospirales bacterium]
MRGKRKKKAIDARSIVLLMSIAALFAYAGFQVYELVFTGIPAVADRDGIIPEVPGSPFLGADGRGAIRVSTDGTAYSLSPNRSVDENYGEEILTGQGTLTGFFVSGLRVDTAADYLGNTPERDAVEGALNRGAEDPPSFLAAIASAGEAPSAPDGPGESQGSAQESDSTLLRPLFFAW